VLENRVVRIFGPTRNEVTGEPRKLYSGELHKLYSSPNMIRQIKSRRMKWVGHVVRVIEERKLYKVLVGKPKGRRPRHRWENGIKVDLTDWLGGCRLDSPGSG
jgi:hypothetical protein